jgi:hypothetical protein
MAQVKRSRAAMVVLLAVGALSGCSRADKSADITVDIADAAVSLHPDTATSGDVSFDINVDSATQRDFLLVLANGTAALPLLPSGALDTAHINVADHLGGLHRGHYFATSPNLRPGRYLVVSETPVAGPGGHGQVWRPGRTATLQLVAPRSPARGGASP